MKTRTRPPVPAKYARAKVKPSDGPLARIVAEHKAVAKAEGFWRDDRWYRVAPPDEAGE